MSGPGVERLLASYPRRRSPLPEAHQRIYVEEYRRNRSGRGWLHGTVARLEAWGHRAAAAGAAGGDLLELGAGSLNHVPYETGVAAYDCVEPFSELFRDSPHRHLVRDIYPDIRAVDRGRRYRRVVAIAVLEHLERLPETVARAALLLEPGGAFQAMIPSEGGFLWGLAWRVTTGAVYRLRTGLPYAPLIRHEHVNDAPEVLAVVDHFFAHLALRRFPLPWHHASFYTFLEAREPRAGRCRAYLEGAGDPASGVPAG